MIEWLGADSQQVLIYGAQIYAVSFYVAWKELYPDIQVLNFVVTEKKGNPDKIDGISVCELTGIKACCFKCPVLIATPEFYHEEISLILKKAGFNRVIPVDFNWQYHVLKNYYCSLYKKEGRSFLTADIECPKTDGTQTNIKIFMAQSIYDKDLKTKIELPDWVYKVQAGASLTEQTCCDITDNTGIHISDKNRNYCELTVAYWLWKNSMDSNYVGLCHYRRYLDIEESFIGGLKAHMADAVLPVPMMVYPDAGEHHKRYIDENDWSHMLEVLKIKYPEYYQSSKTIFHQPYMYLHNIWILSKDCANQFLSWLFTILFEMERLYERDEPKRFDRHMGYLGESLTTLYFMHHKDDLKIYHAKEVVLI